MLFLGEVTLIGIIGGLVGDAIGVVLGCGMAVIAGQVRSQVTGEMTMGGATMGYTPPVFIVFFSFWFFQSPSACSQEPIPPGEPLG